MPQTHFSARDKVTFTDNDGNQRVGIVVATGMSASDSIVVECGKGSENTFHVPPHLLTAA